MDNYVVDAHCDTLLLLGKSLMEFDSNLSKDKDEKSFYRNDTTAVDIEKLQKGNVDLQFMAVFIEPVFNPDFSLKKSLSYIDLLYRKIEENSQYISLIRNFKDLERNKKEAKKSVILALEGGESITNDIAVLRMMYKLGVRCITLTWNYRNNIADGVSDSISGGGLTNFGREVVKEMNRLGIIVDISHISEKGFWDVINITRKPIIASHSCAYKLCNHIRNLNDKQIKAISRVNGAIGINYCTSFLENNPSKATVKSIVNHIEHIAEVGGIDCVGLGSDFDGAKVPKDVFDISQIYKIKDEMTNRGFKAQEINKVMGNNFVRIIKEVL